MMGVLCTLVTTFRPLMILKLGCWKNLNTPEQLHTSIDGLSQLDTSYKFTSVLKTLTVSIIALSVNMLTAAVAKTS